MSKNAIFIHGGPGLNSAAECERLAPILSRLGWQAEFWNEPSRNRPGEGTSFQAERALSGWLESLESAVGAGMGLAIASSFGALAVLHLRARTNVSFGDVVLVSPTIDLLSTFRNMRTIAAKDFESLGEPAKARRLRELDPACSALTDSSSRESMALVYQDPALFPHYWQDSSAMAHWAGFLGQPRYGVDMESQWAVLEELDRLGPLAPPLTKQRRVLVVWGDRDPVRDTDGTRRALAPWFERVEERVIGGAGHFPHLEQPEAFCRVVSEFLGADARA